jgi:hypothetical protein
VAVGAIESIEMKSQNIAQHHRRPVCCPQKFGGLEFDVQAFLILK